jgi:3'-phosphoadenosine 5'-phosphosulfate (PAPS) 3'-phosphatase
VLAVFVKKKKRYCLFIAMTIAKKVTTGVVGHPARETIKGENRHGVCRNAIKDRTRLFP